MDFSIKRPVHRPGLFTVRELPNGAPSHDPFESPFKWIDGKEIERMFILWMKEICPSGEFRVIALDGKTMRGSGDKQTGEYIDPYSQNSRTYNPAILTWEQMEGEDDVRHCTCILNSIGL